MIYYKKIYGKKVYITTPEKWERLQSKPQARKNYVLVHDLKNLVKIKDKPIKEEEE